MKVLLLSKYSRKGASSRLRTMQYIPFLETNGCKVTTSSLFDDEYLSNLYSGKAKSKLSIIKYYIKRLISLLAVFKYDVVWIEKELFPYLPAYFECCLAKLGVKYVVDYDDAIFHNYDLSSSKVISKLLSRKIDNVMKRAHTVVAGNEYLAARANKAGANNVVIIPTVVDTERYTKKASFKEQLVIGWIGSPSTEKYVVQIKTALIKLQTIRPFKLLLVGATKNVAEQLAGLNVDAVAWSESSEADLIKQMDIGIMPLKDGPWEKGKCGYKLIQYMASAVPVVASDVGVNKEIIENSRSGFLANNFDEWFSKLEKLAVDKQLRIKFGENGSSAVKNLYSLQAQSSILLITLKQAAKSGRSSNR